MHPLALLISSIFFTQFLNFTTEPRGSLIRHWDRAVSSQNTPLLQRYCDILALGYLEVIKSDVKKDTDKLVIKSIKTMFLRLEEAKTVDAAYETLISCLTKADIDKTTKAKIQSFVEHARSHANKGLLVQCLYIFLMMVESINFEPNISAEDFGDFLNDLKSCQFNSTEQLHVVFFNFYFKNPSIKKFMDLIAKEFARTRFCHLDWPEKILAAALSLFLEGATETVLREIRNATGILGTLVILGIHLIISIKIVEIIFFGIRSFSQDEVSTNFPWACEHFFKSEIIADTSRHHSRASLKRPKHLRT